MNGTQDKIYQYFERDPKLRVLFIFNNDFIVDELANSQWADGYEYVDSKGDWFTTKYKLDNEWKDKKIVLIMHQVSFSVT